MPQTMRAMGAIAALVVALQMPGLEGQGPEPGRGYPAADWPFVGGNWSSSRYSTLTDITTETVWRWQADDPQAGMVPSWQGVGLGDGLVFVGLRSAEVAALR